MLYGVTPLQTLDWPINLLATTRKAVYVAILMLPHKRRPSSSNSVKLIAPVLFPQPPYASKDVAKDCSRVSKISTYFKACREEA